MIITLIAILPNKMNLIKQISWWCISQSEIRKIVTAKRSGESEGGQKFLPPPLPFCPPERSGFAREARNHSGFCSKNVRTLSNKHRQIFNFEP